jgi:hypothetical protein
VATGIREAQTFADSRLSTGFFARAWVYVPSSSVVATGNYAALLEAQQDGAAYLGIAAQFGPSAVAIADWTGPEVEFVSGDGSFPHDTWTCVEWQVKYGADNGSSDLWIGANDVGISLSAAHTEPSPPYGRFLVQLYFDQVAAPQPAFDIWIDDVVVDAKRIGCAK